MDVASALGLGIVQGLTEFLPVSSSGHLRIGHAMLGSEGVEDVLLFDILLHVGTLVAVLWVYRATLFATLRDAWAGLPQLRTNARAAFEAHEGLRLPVLVGLATLPTVVAAKVLLPLLETDSFPVQTTCGLLLLNGMILWYSRRLDRETDEERAFSVAGIGPREALLIGCAQAFAVLPGISRSGMTIVTALLLGAERMRAAEFSFLMSIPAILGAVVLDFDASLFQEGSALVLPFAVGMLAAMLSGIGALLVVLRILKAARFHHFGVYCFVVGFIGLAYTAT